MRVVNLVRGTSSDQGTFGRWYFDGGWFHSAELPWRGNAANVSCISPGEYVGRWTWSPRFNRLMYLIDGAHGRAGIRLHKANYCGDVTLGYKSHLNGCIALSERVGWLDGQRAALVSAPAVRRFEEYMGGEPFKLVISYA